MTVHASDTLFKNATDLAEAISRGGRDGTLHSGEHPDAETFIQPTEKPNPELLFAGAYAACFHSAMGGVAKALGTPLVDSVLRVRVGQVKDEAGDSRLVVELRAELPGFAADKVRELMETADKLCPYSKALRGDATVVLAQSAVINLP
jgi:lipoyl-dependent peroxiredoxin